MTDVAALLDAIDTAAVDYVAGLRTDALDGVTVGMLGQPTSWRTRTTRRCCRRASASLVGPRRAPAAGGARRHARLGHVRDFLAYLSAGIRHDMMPLRRGALAHGQDRART